MAILVVCMGLLAALVLQAAPVARAATTVTVTVSSGKVGVPQNVTATVSANETSGEMSLIVDGAVSAFQALGAGTKSATFSWVPTHAGTVSVSASFTSEAGTAASSVKRVSIAKVATSTQVSVPSSGQVGSTIQLNATVTAKTGTYVPTGHVTFYNSSGASIGKAGIDGSGKATLDYQVPNSTSRSGVTAAYAGDGNAEGSRSATAYFSVTKATTALTIIVPPTVIEGSRVEVRVEITPQVTGGTVRITFGAATSTKPVEKGVAVAAFTANKVGAREVTATFSGYLGVPAANAKASTTVTAKPKPDTITITPAGSTSPWPANGVVTLANGADVVLQAKALSKLPVGLVIEGPCSLAENVLHVDGVGGTCVLTATTPGGNGYAPATRVFQIAQAAGAQTATVNPPKGGPYKAGTVLVLAPVSATTNVGQPVRWRLDSGREFCKITRKAGKFILTLKNKKGICAVTGFAPAIADQWAPFEISRTYRVKAASR